MSNFQVKAYPGIHKDEITSIHVVKYGSENIEDWKIVTTSTDGFINMIDISTGKINKSYFVHKSGILDSCLLAQQDSFACALGNH
jgi:hypothetical protein